eukprot:364523-Chlamydomonas_euryale.AAC.8
MSGGSCGASASAALAEPPLRPLPLLRPLSLPVLGVADGALCWSLLVLPAPPPVPVAPAAEPGAAVTARTRDFPPRWRAPRARVRAASDASRSAYACGASSSLV